MYMASVHNHHSQVLSDLKIEGLLPETELPCWKVLQVISVGKDTLV